jgi:protein-L-isoaspartate(D-aspartate) O-methyltransferase
MGGESKDTLVASLRDQVGDERVLSAIGSVPRDVFVPRDARRRAWENEALPIGRGQTISQPLVVAHMAELLDLRPGDRVLDVGTGSGYHAAILAELGGRVWSIECDPALSARAREALDAAGVEDVTLVVGDGSLGYPDAAPYDAINGAAAARDGGPPAGARQRAPGGRLVLPVGDQLIYVRRGPDGRLERPRSAGAVRFVPLVGRGEERD